MKIVFLGGKIEGAEALRYLAERWDVMAVDGDNEVKAMARYLDIPCSSQDTMRNYIKGSDFHRIHYGIDLENLDLLIAYRYKPKVTEPLLSFPKLGCVNFHPGLLPKYAGAGGYNIAILEDARIYGCTAHFMTNRIDHGDIIESREVHINRDETAYSLAMRTYAEMFHLLKSVCYSFSEGEVVGVPQVVTRYMKWAEVDKLRPIVQEDDTETIDRKIRAFWFPPHSGAEIELKGKKYTLYFKPK